MAKINLTNKQLRLIQTSLDLYSRIGGIQLDEILSHPTISNYIQKNATIKKVLDVGDVTERGKIVEIGDGFIKTEGSWGNGKEIKTWTDIDKIRLSPDYSKIHQTENLIRQKLSEIKVLITEDPVYYSAYLGIYNLNVDETCREAYDMIQYIRHEFWKNNLTHSNATVDSSIYKSTTEEPIIVKLDSVSEIRKRKITKLNK